MDKNKLVLAIAILLASTILGGFFYASQINKQQSIERQQKFEIGEKRRIEEVKIEQEKVKNEVDAEHARIIREATDSCLVEAHDRYVTAATSVCIDLGYKQQDIDNLKCILPMGQLKRLEDKQKEAQDFCLKAYK